jgi:hypothetical protein
MSLAHDAFFQIYQREPDHRLEIKYHGNFKGYNATVRKTPTTIVFTLSRKFETCEPEIQIGVMQFLLNKLHKTKIKTDNIDFYHSFLKKMSELAPVTENDPELEKSFMRANERFFNGMMSRPNLVWGNNNARLLGTYTYATDTIMISNILSTAEDDTLDYVMYHEMLHKKHKFSHTGSRTRSHTKVFREEERKFTREDKKDPETALKNHLYNAVRRIKRTKSISNAKERTFVEQLLDWF